MRPLADIDRDLDELGVSLERGADTRARALRGRPGSLAAVDAELAELAAGTTPVSRVVAEAPRAPDAAPQAGSGLIEVSEAVLAAAELPAVLALTLDTEGPQGPASAAPNAEIAGALSALALDLDSGETPIELAPETVAPLPVPAVSRSFPPPALESTIDDPNADLGELLGDADPLRADAEPPEAAPLDDLEDDHTAMFTAADAARFSRPAPPDLGEDLEIDIEEVDIEEDEIVQQVAARPPGGRTQPPPPPRTPSEAPKSARPSEAPARGFLGKLLQRKP